MRSAAFLDQYRIEDAIACFAYARARERVLLAVCFRPMSQSPALAELLGITQNHLNQLLWELGKGGLVRHCRNSRGVCWYATAKGRIEVASKIEDARELLGAFSRRLD